MVAKSMGLVPLAFRIYKSHHRQDVVFQSQLRRSNNPTCSQQVFRLLDPVVLIYVGHVIKQDVTSLNASAAFFHVPVFALSSPNL